MRTLVVVSACLVLFVFGGSVAHAIDPPTGLNVSSEPSPSRNINISWTAPAGAVSYTVYRSLAPIVDKTQIDFDFAGIISTNFTDATGVVGETYYYQVTAFDIDGNESVFATPVVNDTATVQGKEFPHRGFSDMTNLCRNCHRVHLAAEVLKIFRKGPEIEICYTCHDGTGSDFDIRTVFDGQAEHDLKLNPKIGTGIKCEHCHFPHGTGFTRMMLLKEENLCFNCHTAGGVSPGDGVAYTAPDVKILFDTFEPFNNATTGHFQAHPVKGGADLHDITEGVQGENSDGGFKYANMTALTRHAECPDCHNPHMAQASNPLRGAAGLAVVNGASGTVPVFNFITAINSEYELCFKCHSSFNGSWDTTPWIEGVRGDKSIEFNPANSAYHPVQAAGRNNSPNLNNALLGGLSITSQINCTDCHNNNETAVVQGPISNFTGTEAVGPHGSTNAQIRRGNYFTDISGPGSWNANNFELCFLCHNVNQLVLAREWRDGASTNFYDDVDGNDNLHWLHLEDRIDKSRATCRNCHYNIHSNIQAQNTQYRIDGVVTTTPPASVPTRLINFSPDILPRGSRPEPEWVFDTSTKVRRCNLDCHDNEMANFPYRPDQGDFP